MKFAIEIVAVLAVAFLALAEAVEFDKSEIKDKIIDQLREGLDMCQKFADQYMEKSYEYKAIVSAKYVLASKMMQSVGRSRWDDMVLISDDILVGNDYVPEVRILHVHSDKIDQQVDGLLESLLKLAAELPNDNTIADDVKEVVKNINKFSDFMSDLVVAGS